jgi:hypothetical protein
MYGSVRRSIRSVPTMIPPSADRGRRRTRIVAGARIAAACPCVARFPHALLPPRKARAQCPLRTDRPMDGLDAVSDFRQQVSLNESHDERV